MSERSAGEERTEPLPDDEAGLASVLRRAQRVGDQVLGPPLPKPGHVVGGKYRLEQQLGLGGMGAVYRATHLVSEKPVAVKWMLRSTSDDHARRRFLRAARVAGRIDHPNAVDVYDVWNTSWGLTDRVHVMLDPAAIDAPFFQLQSGELALEVPATEAAALGSFGNVEPRLAGYELVFTHERGGCLYSSGEFGGWPPPSGRPNATWVPARAGYRTWPIIEHCKASPASAPDAAMDMP
jgi:serine/threonine protein kinase